MRFSAVGRGRDYSAGRGLWESALRFAFRGDWPARLWEALGPTPRVATLRHQLTIDGTGPSCRVAFVSDLHVGPATPNRALDVAFAALEDARPDVLLLGGDYVFLDAEPARLARLAALVRSVPAATKLAVLGNHDLWADDRAIAEVLAGAGATVLVNQCVRLPDPWQDVAVVGLDDPWAGACDVADVTANLETAAARLVVCHGPDGLDFLDDVPFDLFMCGHTHGGQVATPWGPVIMPRGRRCREFAHGFGVHAGRTVFTSRGVGGVELPVRSWAPADVLIVDLVRAIGPNP